MKLNSFLQKSALQRILKAPRPTFYDAVMQFTAGEEPIHLQNDIFLVVLNNDKVLCDDFFMSGTLEPAMEQQLKIYKVYQKIDVTEDTKVTALLCHTVCGGLQKCLFLPVCKRR